MWDTDLLEVSGHDMVEALIAGEGDTEKLADKARKRLRKKIPELQTALQGRVTCPPPLPIAVPAGSRD